ncbi:glycosyltransferase [Geodermatophilus sp. SYSU D01186]
MTEPVTVSVVVTTYQHAHFLGAALASVAAQTRSVDEVIVVDDGSTDDPASVVAQWAGTIFIRQDNQGLAAARNTGLHAARSAFVLFLDADDLLTPVAVAAGLECFARHSEAALVYGAHRRVAVDAAPLGGRVYIPAGCNPRSTLLRGNSVAMHATALYRRDLLLAAGGFDETLPRCEDYDVYLRLACRHLIASHPVETALYRWHNANMSNHVPAMLMAALRVHARHRPRPEESAELHRAWWEGRANWRAWYARELLDRSRDPGVAAALTAARLAPAWFARALVRSTIRRLVNRLPGWAHDALARRVPALRARPRGRVRLGDLDRPEPISMDFGWDRGTPVDRFFIEGFLNTNREDVAGRVLEVGDDAYSRRFGGDRITSQDILHVHAGNPLATIVGNISDVGVLPSDTFDCIILTQTLHLVWDMHAAIRQLHAALRPGGVLLLTVPGISQIDRGEWGDQWYWSLTPAAVQRLVGDVFGSESVSVESHGNVYAATTFLQGLAVEEVDVRSLTPQDLAYPVVVTARAQKLPWWVR